MNLALRQRILLAVAVLLMLVPTFLLAAGKIGQPPLFEGDVRREMTCITCDGLGRQASEPEQEPCSTCKGAGVAEFIISGPNRPLQLVGTVTDGKNVPLAGTEVRAQELENQEFSLIVNTNSQGQFGLKLPPGEYRLLFAHEQGSLDTEFEVPADARPLPVRGADTLHRLEHTFVLE